MTREHKVFDNWCENCISKDRFDATGELCEDCRYCLRGTRYEMNPVAKLAYLNEQISKLTIEKNETEQLVESLRKYGFVYPNLMKKLE